MSALENARAFFDACESGEGWAGCQQYVAEGATFSRDQMNTLMDLAEAGNNALVAAQVTAVA